MIRILIPKKYQVSSIMIHFWYSISISITDTFRVYQYHKSLIHGCDTFTGIIQNSLFTRLQCVDSSSWVFATVSRIKDFSDSRHDPYRHIVKLETIYLIMYGTVAYHQLTLSTGNVSTTWVTLTLNWKCWQDAVESSKFSLNSTLLHQLKDCSTRLDR